MLEINKIYDQDCLEGMKLLNDRSIDLICTDLPYGVTQNKSDIVIPFEPLWKQYERIIKENGAIVLFGQGVFYIDLVESNRKLFRYDLVWDKMLTTGFLNAKKMPLRQHEQIAVFYKKLQHTILSPPLENHYIARVNVMLEMKLRITIMASL
jgi:site-specific DNA-methyltransferase (adenine-specific)